MERERREQMPEFKVGDMVMHPFTGKKVRILHLGNQVVKFVPPNETKRRGFSHMTVIVGSPRYYALKKTSLVEQDVSPVNNRPSAELPSHPDEEFYPGIPAVTVVPLEKLERA
ncbi:MAG: hypothetical protein HW383_502 [Candidatus Magasanikbacteria bacterium]|nr:hypothetical protein [Candidatus Magasanikbacteria bacterium]